MNGIMIKNSTVHIVCEDTIGNARDNLLTKMYYARNKSTMGGYDAWLKLLDMYYACDFKGMQELIRSCKGMGGKTRNECLRYLDIIMRGN